ncbi:MAG: DUF2975 domain-containing protein [Pseudomonadota bacterium]
MQHTRLLTTVRWGALAMMILMSIETARYAYDSVHRAWRFSFGDPQRWNAHWAVDAGTMIGMGPRTGYFILWIAVVLASLLCFAIGLYLLNRIRRLQLFDMRTALTVRALGLALAFAMAFDQVFQAVDLYLVTRFNANGPEPIMWRYDPSDIKTFSIGILMFLFGWIMHKGIDVARENKGFI